jgi:iron complex outermembrane receptor protein
MISHSREYMNRALFALFCALILSALHGHFAFAAQEAPLELERFQVTGTHIKRVDLEGTSPVFVLDRADIERSGATTVNELFRKVVYNTAGVVDESFTQGFAPASAGIDLRGLGVSRTLVLVNGRRVPLFPFAEDGSQSFVDINLIPLGAIERIEILKDGASAIYGADAIAGVVNIILRNNYDGAVLSADYGGTTDGDGQEGHLSVVAGREWQDSSITFVFDNFDRDPVDAIDRDISASANGAIDDRSRAGNPGTIIGPTGPQPDPRCPPGSIDGPFCVFDFAPYNTLIPKAERTGMTAAFEHEISNSMSVFARAMYTHSKSERSLAPAPTAFTVDGTNPNNPSPGDDLLVIYRLLELNPRVDEFKTDAYNLLAGLDGTVGVWDWELSAGYGDIDTTSKGISGYATQAALQQEVDDGTLNLFGSSPTFSASDVSYKPKREGKSKLYSSDLKATGELLEMRHGVLEMAVGAEYRHEDFRDKFDSTTANDEVVGIGGTSGKGDRNVQATFVEFAIPALSNLEFQVAGRYDHYSDFGGELNPKLGLRWQAREDLLVRGSAGTGFKAPTLQELYSGDIVGFESVFDTTNCEAARQANDPALIAQYCDNVQEVAAVTTGNPDLDAEKSNNFSVGVVWDATDRWDMAVDLWRIKADDAVVSNAQYMVDNEALFSGNVTRDGSGDIVAIVSPFQNVSTQKLWGVDIDTGFELASTPVGDFRLGVAATHLVSFNQRVAPGQSSEEFAGKDGNPEWRAQSTLTWGRANYAASLVANYVDGYERRDVNDSIGNWKTVDAQFNWQPRPIKGGTVTLGAENVFNSHPSEDPFLEGWPFFNRALHSPRERFLYARFKYEY